MKISKVVTFLCFAWIPVLVVFTVGAESSARGAYDSEADEIALNSALEHRFSPTRYDYPSGLLGTNVSLMYGAYQGDVAAQTKGEAIGRHEIIVTAHDQGDLNKDGLEEAILLVEESLCTGSNCKVVRHLDVWTHRSGDIVRMSRIPVSAELELESVGIQIRGSEILLTMVDLDAEGDLREVSERWRLAREIPTLVETRIGDHVGDEEGGC